MPALLSLVTSVKDYIEIAHKLLETQNTNFFLAGTRDTGLTGADQQNLFGIRDYNEFGAILTYFVLSVKEFFANFFNSGGVVWSLPLVVPDVASAMISEISVLDSYFTNSFSFLENGLNSNVNSNANTLSMATENIVNAQKLTQNPFLFGFEKFVIGFLNSFFLFLPTSTAHLITVRRFVMQGIEAGFIAGLGTIAGNFVWLASIILGLRFIVIPWLSLDIFRYVLGFMLLVKYLWDTSKEVNKTNQTNLEVNSQIQIFALNFLLALTEQTSIYPFISNMSFGADGSILEGFSNFGLNVDQANPFLFFSIHGCYLFGILLGSFSLLQFTVWFWENPAFSIYMWIISSSRVKPSVGLYYKVLNFVFLYLTMLCAISSIPYFGLDYTVTNPLGMIPQDRIIEQRSFSATGPGDPILPETSFLGMKSTDKNSRIRDGVHARRERWKERLIKYQAFDATAYSENGVYDILTVEDLNYGFDRFWLRRKMRNHQIRFRLFPGPWMRSLKKQLNKPGFTGPRTEFFRILFEQYYHPSFHTTANKKISNQVLNNKVGNNMNSNLLTQTPEGLSQSILVPSTKDVGFTNPGGYFTGPKQQFTKQKGLISEYSALRKFSQNVNTRLKASAVTSTNAALLMGSADNLAIARDNKLVYSKSLKSLFNKIQKNKETTSQGLNMFRTLSKNLLLPAASNTVVETNNFGSNVGVVGLSYGKLPAWYSKESAQASSPIFESFKKTSMRKPLSKKERALLISSTQLFNKKSYPGNASTTNNNIGQRLALNMYSQQNAAFKRKLQYYSTAVTRKFSVGNNAPYFKTILKRAFYYHKPTLRLKRTLFTAAMRRGFRKKSVMPKKLVYKTNSLTTGPNLQGDSVTSAYMENANTKDNTLTKYLPTQQYSVLGKRASRYRYQIYKDVLQHWYYTPFNRLLLKFDVDSFINRQPKSHFLTKKEERLLHLRRVLLAEHYNTLRWYTYMQHYRTMKSRIGGTKSFASTVYNQQFQGTFKKIRHLFAITPIQGGTTDMSVLKFDQPLYRSEPAMPMGLINSGGPSTGVNSKEKQSILKGDNQKRKYGISSYKHEDLTKDEKFKTTSRETMSQKQEKIGTSSYAGHALGVIDQSLNAVGRLVKIQKADSISLQANSNILTPTSEKLLENIKKGNASRYPENPSVILDLLKEAKKRLNNPAGFLKNYISHRIDKREQRNTETSKELRAQLETLKTWLSPISNTDSIGNTNLGNASRYPRSFLAKDNLAFETTTGVRKALNDGLFVLNNVNPTFARLQTENKAFLGGPRKNLVLRRYKELSLQTSLVGNDAKKQQINQTLVSVKNVTNLVDEIRSKTISGSYLKNSKVTTGLFNKLTNVQTLLNTVLKPFMVLQNQLLTKRTTKNLEWWRQKQRALNKRASSRKKERLNYIESNINSRQQNKANVVKTSLASTGDYNSYLLALDTNQKTSSSAQVKLDFTKKVASTGLALTPEGFLRKKTESNGQNDMTKQIFEKFLVRKLRKKRARSRSYRKPYYANIVRPKNASSVWTSLAARDNFATREVMSNYLENFNGVLDSKTLAALQADMSSQNMISGLLKEDKSVIFKTFKQNLAKTIAIKATPEDLQNQVATEAPFGAANRLKNLLVQGQVKKSPSKKRSKRTSRKRKRQKFSINHERYRKRQNHGLGKLRNLAKKMKRIKSTQEFQNWWWNTYLPNYATQSSRVTTNSTTVPLGLSNSRYAPLSTTKALDIKGTLTLNTALNSSKQNNSVLQNDTELPQSTSGETVSILDKIYGNFAETQAPNLPQTGSLQLVASAIPSTTPKLNATTTIPFYAGWDESLRKFVVTNRLLSRRAQQAGFEVNLNGIFSNSSSSTANQSKQNTSLTEQSWQFTNAPINGLNEASFLYLQTEMPFNSYTIDQFIPNNQSFYAPLGWKRFQFRHTLLKNWLNHSRFSKNASKSVASQSDMLGGMPIYLTNNSISNFEYFSTSASSVEQQTRGSVKGGLSQKQTSKLQNRRIKKRYKLLRQTPIQLMYVPTGSLLTETLPSHYISVFDKQYRFPRNRYIKRNLPKSNSNSMVKNLTISDYSGNVGVSTDFTLRKRIKPKRKYHKKRFTKKDGLIFPRRRKFGNISTETTVKPLENTNSELVSNQESTQFRLRPSMRANINITKGAIKSKKQGRNSGKANAIRLRQLRRREFQQVFKPLQRYQPRNGGFTWPGDYLRLQIIPMPKLEPTLITPVATQTNLSSTPTKVKTKINSQPIGLLPRKYLLQKHNLKVFKKKIALKYGTF